MKENNVYTPDHAAIYPGEYEPLPHRKEALMDALRKADSCIIKPPVNIGKHHEHYKIEIAMPGLKREDLFVDTNGRVLTVAGLYNKQDDKEEEDENFRSLIFDHKCIRQEIELPADADADFVAAEYHDGILTVWIYKTKYPGGNIIRDIIVY